MARVENVNTTDIRDAIRLGCRTMCSVFDADDHDVPFFRSSVRPDAYLAFYHGHSESHVPGRHLNALLNAQDATGVELDETAIDKHTRAAMLSYSGPVALPLNRQTQAGLPVVFLPHNIREGFHALYALVRYRDSAWARATAEASIAAIQDLWHPTEGWDVARLENALGLHCLGIGALSTFVTGLARAIGPLVKYYRATRYAPALDLALALKDKALAEFFGPDGAYDPARFGTHTHSTTCVMSSLAQLADLLGDASLMERVKAFYDNGLWCIRDALGWVIENSGPQAHPDRGEVNNTGDIVETALILGRWGYAECYADAERIVRGHLLPSQLRDTSFIVEGSNPEGIDGRRDVANRHLGAYGFPAPYGHEPLDAEGISFNMDIVGGAVGSLCEVYREATRRDSLGHWVNLLFDHETPDIAVESPYTHPSLSVRVKRPGALWVRVPPWVDPQNLTITGTTETPRLTNDYLFLASPPVNRAIRIAFPLVEHEIALEHRTRTIRARLRGDEVVVMAHHGADLTFFDSLEP